MKKLFGFVSITLFIIGLFFLLYYFFSAKNNTPVQAVSGEPAFGEMTVVEDKPLEYQAISEESVRKEATDATPDVVAVNYYVSPSGSDSADGLSEVKAFKSIQKAIDLAQSGETINLTKGTYLQDFVSKRNGNIDAPIIIKGTAESIVKGGGKGRVIEINHDHIVLDGFTVDGFFDSAKKVESYRDKLIYALGKEKKDGVTGFKIKNMNIKNAGGECIRLRYFATKNEIVNNVITNCGVVDFKFDGGGKNGEGIYIGTAPEQLKDGKNPTTDPDQSNENWIHDNVIDTQGNECVDIKESSSGNIVERNKCTGQKDTESAGLDARGNGNIFRNNQIFGCLGAGVRLGGDEKSDGINNIVSANNIYDNKNGGVKVMRSPQTICGNTVTNCGKGICVGDFSKKFDPIIKCSS
ncbi:MAG: Secreted protein [Candidatus Moranbacteria bacterium GW2011_GWE1_35_17]|nr:MAG: Secreted protein [Candidatus Moranbacteria bacterium GW2011_GWE1_35_17]